MIHNDKDSVESVCSSARGNDKVQKLGKESHAFGAHFGQSLHDLNFSDNFDQLVFIISEVFDHFDGYILACVLAGRSHHAAVRSLSLFFNELVISEDFFPNFRETVFLYDRLVVPLGT